MKDFHPAMSTMHHLDPEFLCPKEMIMAYASQVHRVPNLPTSASNLGMQPGVLCTMGWVETFSQRVQALYDSGRFQMHVPLQARLRPGLALSIHHGGQSHGRCAHLDLAHKF